MALLNYQGWRNRKALELTTVEELLTRSYVIDAASVAAIGLLSCAIALALPVRLSGLAGYTYMLVAIQKRVHFRRARRKVRTLQALQVRDSLPAETEGARIA